MIVSVTERGTYKRCRRQWDFSSENRQGIQPIINPSLALSLGTLIHRTLADWIQDPTLTKWAGVQYGTGFKDGDLSELFTWHASRMMIDMERAYYAAVGMKPSSTELAPLLSSVELPIPEKYTFVMPEQEIQVPVPGTEHPCPRCINNGVRSFPCDYCKGTGVQVHYLKGKLDGLVQDEYGLLWVLEHKTYSSRPNKAVLDDNDQFLAYIWIVTQLNIGECGGILYDGMLKKRAPTRTETLRDLFTRTKLTRTQAELEEFQTHLAYELKEMASDPFITVTKPWMGCFDCGYRDLCGAMSRKEDVNYIRNKLYTKRTPDVSALEV
jgi:hypothetical protein